jgi:O-antigen/teichoic acid export membrane protein
MLKKILQKSLNYFMTLVGGKLLTALFFVWLARVLQPEKFGLVTYFMTWAQIISVLGDLGLRSWYQKQLAQRTQAQLLAGIMRWRLMLAGVSVVVVGVSQWWWGWLDPTLVPPLMITLGLEALLTVADAHYLARGQSLRLGYKLIARNLLLLLSVVVVKTPTDYEIFLQVYNATLAVVAIVYVPWRELWQQRRAAPRWPKIKATLPYAAIDDLGIIYGRADQLILEKLRGAGALGIYGAAYRYIEAINLLPQALFHNLFPIAAQRGGIKRRQLLQMTAMMTVAGTVIALMIAAGSEMLTVWLLGPSYAEAATVLRHLAPLVVIFFANAPVNTVLQSHDRVRRYVPYLGLVVIINIALNWLLIPKFELLGAVYAIMAAQLALVGINWWLWRRWREELTS